MSKPKHQAFLDLEEALARRLSGAWSRYWTDIERRMRSLVEAGQFDQAHALAEAIDVGPLFQRNRRFAQTVGMAALLLGASRVKPHRSSKVAAKPPKRELEKLLDQTQIMLARNASQKLRELAHAWINSEEHKLAKYDPDQPRDERGRWTEGLVHGSDGKPQVYYHAERDVEMQIIGQEVAFFPKQPLDFRGKTEPGLWLTPDPKVASKYGTPIPYYVRAGRTLREESPLAIRPDADIVYRTRGKGERLEDAWEIAVFDARQLVPVHEKPLAKFDPAQPRHPKGTPEGGQWADLKVVAGTDGPGSVRIVVRNESVRAKDPATIEARPWTVLEADDQPRKGLQVNWSEVADKWQGTGLGVRIYAKLADYAHSKGMTLFSDSQVSADAQRIYEALRRRGYQVEQNPKAVSTKDGKLIVGWPTLPRDQWVYRVTNPTLAKAELAKFDPTDTNRNQVRINVAGKNYFGIAASVQVSRLSAFGFLLEAAEAGVTNYRIDAVLDERTCAVCQQLDGWVFPVEQGMQLAQLIMETDDPDALKQIAPFYAQNKQAVAELITYSTDDWVAMGMHLPPYHPLCRCILTPTEQKSDLHPTQIEDRVALAAQTLYGEGEGVRLTRELFGVEPEARPQRLGDVIPDLALEAEDVAGWLDMVRDSGEPGENVASAARAPEKAAEWIQDVVTEWLAQPSADVAAPPLITPTPFEGSTVPQDYVEPFRPSRLAQLTQSRWPWLAGIFGWLALRDPAATEEAALIAEEEAADEDRDDRDELREDRRR
jgi:GNAT superfamily N-acetyltransferase